MDDSFYNYLVEKAKSDDFLYHFTNLDSLKIILQNSSFRLSRLDVLNDPAKAKRVEDFWYDKVYSFSFCSGNVDYEYFWNNYAKAENKGVCIVLKNFEVDDIDNIYSDSKCTNKIEKFKSRTDMSHKEYGSVNDWCVYDISKASVLYVDNLEDYTVYESIIFHNDAKNSLCPGLIKKKQGYDSNGIIQNWKRENEQRIRVAIRPKGLENRYNSKTNKFEVIKPEFSNLYFHIPCKIERIIVNPFVSQEAHNEIKKQIKFIDSNINVE